LFFNFALDYAIRRIQVNQDGFKLNGTYQILFYANDVNNTDGSVLSMKRNTETVAGASKETRLEVIAVKTKCMVMSRDQLAGRTQCND
jgi:hypothetical protein